MTTCRLLWYSTYGGTSFPSPRRVIHPWDDNLSTTTVLDSNWDKIYISQEDLFIREVTIRRLLWYSTQAETRSLFPKRIYSPMRWQFVDYYSTRFKLRQDHYFPRGFIHPWGDNSSTTTVLDSTWDKISISQEDLFIHEVTIHRLLWYSTQAEARSL